MEHVIPDFNIYNKYKECFGKGKRKQTELKTILYATHIRLSLDGRTLEPFPYERLQPYHPSVILHDYDLSTIPNAFELLQDISSRRPSGLPYRIGNKYPINIYSFDELIKWLKLPPMQNCFYLQYNGLLKDEEVNELASRPILGLRQMFYNAAYGCSDENQFMMDVLPSFYKHLVFFRSHNAPVLLNIDDEFFKTRELLNLMKLLNCYYGKKMNEFFQPSRQTLYAYCACKTWAYLETFPWARFTVTRDEMRESFQYMRKHNYEVFDMFYSIPDLTFKGGKFINEWSRD